MNNIISMKKQHPEEYFIRLCNSPASRSALRRRVIWMHVSLFLSGLFFGLAIGGVVL